MLKARGQARVAIFCGYLLEMVLLLGLLNPAGVILYLLTNHNVAGVATFFTRQVTDFFHNCTARFVTFLDEILMIVVGTWTQKACLASAFAIQGHLCESLCMGKITAFSISWFEQEIQRLTSFGNLKLPELGCGLHW